MLTGVLAATLSAAGLTWVAIRWLAPRAVTLGFVDRPGGRKRHRVATPTIGGLAIAFGLMFAIAVFSGGAAHTPAFLAACALLIVTGALDDIFDLHWGVRIIAQVTASLLMIFWGGVRVHYLGDLGLPFPTASMWISVPITVFATVGLINAVNMCDGSDGLSGMLCATVVVMLTCAAVYSGNVAPLWILLPLLACILVFLRYNLRRFGQSRARIFLGNSGSMFLGFVIAHEIFRLTQNPAHPVSPVLALWLFIPPVLDCLVLIVRRLRMGRSPFNADRGHMHHFLLDAGFDPSQVAAKLAAVQMALGLIAASLLRLDAVRELHLLLAFGVLGVGYYMLTSRRARAMRFYLRVARTLDRFSRSPSFPTVEAAGEPVRLVTAPQVIKLDGKMHASVERHRDVTTTVDTRSAHSS